jgi:site-specific DNA-methyltransferase (adenine-specific)
MPPEIRIFNEDCLSAMQNMKDRQYDLAIVDPPYRVAMTGRKSPANGFKGVQEWDKMRLGWDQQRPGPEYFNELFRVSKNQIVWGANYFTERLPPSMGWVFWYKMQDNFSFSDGEFAFTSFHSKARIFKYGRGMESGFAPGGCAYPNIHPTQKPVRLYEWLLKNYAKQGDRILDTHLGSGSIAIACEIMGYDLDGYEIDKEYYDAASKRLERHRRQSVFQFEAAR